MARIIFVLMFSLVFGQTAKADLEVNFIEGAPKDKFLIENVSQCVLNDLVLTIDLSNSVGKLIFDTTETGLGVEVFQPFEVVKGNIKLISSVQDLDGSDEIVLNIVNLKPNAVVGFTIDVDDTLLDSRLGNIRVVDSEIKNGKINLQVGDEKISSSAFGENSKAVISTPSC